MTYYWSRNYQLLQQLSESNEKLEKKAPNSTELRIRETQLSFLSKWFIDLMSEHSNNQSDIRIKYKDHLKRQLEVMGKVSGDPVGRSRCSLRVVSLAGHD